MCRTTSGASHQVIKMKSAKKERNKTPPKSNTVVKEVPKQTSSPFTIQQQEAFDMIQMRFLINLPLREMLSVPRLFFQIEQAHWFYEDVLAEVENAGLPRNMSLHEFGLQLFTYCEPLQPLKSQYKQLYDEFSAYKNKVPTCGCILLNEACDKLLLVCNWKRTTWSFPKGKVNENEDAAVGAMREVYEEIGYRPVVDPEENITLVSDSGQLTTMFIVPGLPEDFAYTPKARKEISEVRFFYLENPLPNEKFNFNKYKTPLKAWIKKYKQQQKSGGKKKNNLKSDLVNVEKSIPLTDSVASLFATTTNGQADALASLFGSNESFPNKQNGLTDSVASLFGTTSTTSTKQPKQIKVLQKAGSPNSVGTPPNQAASGDISNKKFSLNVNNVFD